MKDILIISPNEEHFHLFNLHLGHLALHFSWGGHLPEALEDISIEKPAIVFIIHEQYPQLVKWLDDFNAANTGIPAICGSGFLEEKQRITLWEKGAIDVFCFPINRKELEYRLKYFIANETDSGSDRWEMRGRLEDLNLIDLIQSFEAGNKNGILHLQKGTQKGRIEFNKGKIVNARLAKRDPLEAIEVMATWFYGRFWTELDKEKHTKRILLDNQQIILECLNHINLQYKLLSQLPSEEVVLYSKPDLNYEELGPVSRTVLLSFKEGNTIQKFLENYSDKSIPILERMIKWKKDGLLLEKAAYEQRVKKLEKEQEESGLLKMVSKIFAKSDEEERKTTQSEKTKFEEEEMTINLTRRPYLFNRRETITEFIKAIEETL